MSSTKPEYFRFWKSQFWYDRQMMQAWRTVPGLLRALYGIIVATLSLLIVKVAFAGKIHGIWLGLLAAAAFIAFGMVVTWVQHFLIDKYGHKEE